MLDFNLWTLVFNIINVLVLFLFLKIFLFKPVTAIMEKRASAIKNTLQEADSRKAEADQLKQDYQKELKHAGDKASEIMKEARERAEIEQNRILQEAKEEAAKVITEAEISIELLRKKSLESAQAEIAGIAMLAAAKLVGKNVDNNTNQELLGDFLHEVGAGK